jgi:LuxR family maltose regulon positive regulatory protein
LDQLLTTKLFVPLSRPKIVVRPRLVERLNEGLQQKLTLVSAPAGFGKTTLVSEWVTGCQHPIAWLSLDEGDNDPKRFLLYFVAALQTLALKSPRRGSEDRGIGPKLGAGVLGALQSAQPPPPESILTALLNDITTVQEDFVLVLDDYHLIDSKPVDQALTFLLEHQPPNMHLVIATREDPQLPLARLRALSQLTELRVAELRFTLSEAAEFLNRVMGLDLSAGEITALETRTEGWIVGLQLAAISMQGRKDTATFIKSFTGSHQYVLDYLLEEVLNRQPESVQTFLLRTSILDRLYGPLCDAVVLDASVPGQETLEYLSQANLFIIPLDDERRWYRYHHLFADLLRQRLQQRAVSSVEDESGGIDKYHIRASEWYETHGLDIEAFQHATTANDIERATRLLEGKGMPLHFRGAVVPVLNWLASLPATVMDARPSLWVMYASVLSMTGQMNSVEPKLQAAEKALRKAEQDDKTRNLIGHIAAIRALLAATREEVEAIISQSQRALEFLNPDNLAVRTATVWKLGIAYQIQGDRAAAIEAYSEAIAISQASGNLIINISATIGLGVIQEMNNQLYQAAETYRHVIQLVGEQIEPAAIEAYLGLARIYYEWNDLETAQKNYEQSVQRARQLEYLDRYVPNEVFLARLKFAQGDTAEATAILTKASESSYQTSFAYQKPDIASVQVLALLRQGDLTEAADLAEKHERSISQARVQLARGDEAAALATLEPLRQQAEAKGWQDEKLQVMVLQALAYQALGEKEQAVELLKEALILAKPGGFIRIFIDEGQPMAHLLSEAATQGVMADYAGRLLVEFHAEKRKSDSKYTPATPLPLIASKVRPVKDTLIEPLSQRELEVLRLIAQGLSNREIGERLYLALSTVKGHNRVIYGKLQVQRRTEAVSRARELGLL